jgi:3'-phosphoadenosine 5'-phosphosulfate sulfotransferase (PAPS reductase)/FAD synthetase
MKHTIRIISVSGGKDSTACALLALERHPQDEIRLIFADTSNEHELTIDYVTNVLPRQLGHPIIVLKADFTEDLARKRRFILEKWPEQGIDPEICQRAAAILEPTGIAYLDLCLWKGRFPSRKAQFCTQFLKRHPLDNYTLDQMGPGRKVEVWQGVRRDESQSRAHLPEYEDAAEGFVIYRPILDWTAQQSVDYVRSRGVELNPLYKKGFARVGCAPCINSGKEDVNQWARTFPEMIEKIAEWERLVGLASKRGESSFFPAPDAEGRGERQGRNIREFVEWAKTSHGGYQYALHAFMPSPTCSSVYGLCE